jgi:hypothetical protein
MKLNNIRYSYIAERIERKIQLSDVGSQTAKRLSISSAANNKLEEEFQSATIGIILALTRRYFKLE